MSSPSSSPCTVVYFVPNFSIVCILFTDAMALFAFNLVIKHLIKHSSFSFAYPAARKLSMTTVSRDVVNTIDLTTMMKNFSIIVLNQELPLFLTMLWSKGKYVRAIPSPPASYRVCADGGATRVVKHSDYGPYVYLVVFNNKLVAGT